MSEISRPAPPKSGFGNVLDFVERQPGDSARFDLEVAVMDDRRVVVFHSHKFKSDISWFEFDLSNNRLDFILEDGANREIGLPLTADVAKNMQNAHQILTVLMDPKTGQAQSGKYVPLIIHRS